MPLQINIQPEPFEFDMKLRDYEGESFESGFGEYESGRPQAAAPPCPPYERGEVEKSRTQAGHLPSDVIQHRRGLLIADFGVGSRTPRDSLRRDAALKNWINTMIQIVRANPTTEIRISGYSDCVGGEKNNAILRRGRAQRVAQLLQQLAGPHWRAPRAKIKFVGAAPANDYVADNATIQGRAQNRGVLITHTRIVPVEPLVLVPPLPPRTTDVEPPDFIGRILQRARELYQRTDKWHQFGSPLKSEGQRRRILCLLSQMSKPGLDDRYLDRRAVERYAGTFPDPRMTTPQYISATNVLLPDDAVRPGLKMTDTSIWLGMQVIDDAINDGVAAINFIIHSWGHYTVPRRANELRDWVEKQRNNQRSIYWCYGPHAT
jgi:outer membrane protein OmpA-like peptidoglycan-associated protein